MKGTSQKSEYGTYHLHLKNTEDRSQQHNQTLDVPLSLEFLTALHTYHGSAWKTFQGIRIELPTTAWNDYGSGKMNKQSAHNFRQLAWTQLSQFNQEDLKEALNNLTLYHKLPSDHSYLDEATNHKAKFINLVFSTNIHHTIIQWVKDDKWYDPQLSRVYPESYSNFNANNLSTKQLNNCKITSCTKGPQTNNTLYPDSINHDYSQCCPPPNSAPASPHSCESIILD